MDLKGEVEIEALHLSFHEGLEVDLESKLSEAPFVVSTTCNATLLCLDRERAGIESGCPEDKVICSQDVEVVVVQNVKTFRAELEVDLFVDGEDLADRGIEVPCSRPTECIAGGHRRRDIWRCRCL